MRSAREISGGFNTMTLSSEVHSTSPHPALRGMGSLFLSVGIFSAIVNLLMLVAPLYMLQIYDRVLSSRSEETLIVLTGLVAALFVVMGILDHMRSRIAARIGATFQARLDRRVFRAVLRRSVLTSERSRPSSGLRDLESVQKLFSSPVLFAVFDMPWAPLFLLVIYGFHPWLGHLALAGTIVLAATTILNQMATRKPEAAAARAMLAGDSFAEAIRQQGETVQALGMREAALERWADLRRNGLLAQLSASDRVGKFTTFSKIFRFALQSGVLFVGALLVLKSELSAGAMIAASILLGRALAPVEQAIGGWPLVLRARAGWAELKRLLESTPGHRARTELPRPEGDLAVAGLTVYAPEAKAPSLRSVSFSLRPGLALGVIGASAAGKTTLARTLVGLWPPAAGSVTLDGAPLDQYDPEMLGQAIGYLPQDVALFDGTVAENIARLSRNPEGGAIVEAAKRAGAHEMILGLPLGYDTPVAAGGARLSGGQRQRIGLARALYGNPVLLVLDEPNSALDAAGSDALNAAVRQAKADGASVVIMAHRPAGIAECDLILILENGAVRACGPRDEVLRAHVRNYAQVAPAPQGASAQGVAAQGPAVVQTGAVS